MHAVLAVVCLAAAAVLLQAWPATFPSATAENAPRAAGPALGRGGDGSWPTCAHPRAQSLVPSPAFAIVGLNDGDPGTRSACLQRTLRWAATATGGTTQPRIAFYLMAADPWQPAERRWTRPVWPRSAVIRGERVAVPGTYGGPCTGSHTSRACAYLFGWSAAARSAALPGVPEPARHRYWIDVENEADFSADRLFNQAIVEGMVAYVTTPASRGGLGSSAGLYSNVGYWAAIVGPLRRDSPLAGLDNWYPIGPGGEADARRAFRTLEPFTPGSRITIVQVVRGAADIDYAPRT
ncbi:MAG: hypothetical protein QOC59_1464 [Microbacteriaceae bacterium]|nr:hypothetical protein [Microbacteriaceae bacterium]